MMDFGHAKLLKRRLIMERRCEIIFKGTDVKIVFRGIWTRNAIDLAYRAMLSTLPTHIMEKRKEIENGNKREDSRRTA